MWPISGFAKGAISGVKMPTNHDVSLLNSIGAIDFEGF